MIDSDPKVQSNLWLLVLIFDSLSKYFSSYLNIHHTLWTKKASWFSIVTMVWRPRLGDGVLLNNSPYGREPVSSISPKSVLSCWAEWRLEGECCCFHSSLSIVYSFDSRPPGHITGLATEGSLCTSGYQLTFTPTYLFWRLLYFGFLLGKGVVILKSLFGLFSKLNQLQKNTTVSSYWWLFR